MSSYPRVSLLCFAVAAAGEKSILSVTYGMDGCVGIDTRDTDTLEEHNCVVVDGVTAAVSKATIFGQCKKWISNADAMPITFSAPVDPDTVDGSDFNVTLNTGDVVSPLCLFANPADEDNEFQTFAAIGYFGDGWADTIYPVSIDIVGDLLFSDGSNAKDLRFEIAYSHRFAADSPFIVQADLLPFSTDGESDAKVPGGVYPNHCQHLYGDGITHRVRVVVSGGATLDGVNSLLPDQTDAFHLLDASGNRIVTPVVGLADLGAEASGSFGSYDNDGDNFFDVCLDASKGPVDSIAQVRMPCDEIKLYLPSGGTPCVDNFLDVRSTVAGSIVV